MKKIVLELTPYEATALLMAAEIGIFERMAYIPDVRIRKAATKAAGKLKSTIKKEK